MEDKTETSVPFMGLQGYKGWGKTENELAESGKQHGDWGQMFFL